MVAGLLNMVGGAKDILMLVSLASTILLGWMKYNDSQEINRLENNMYSKAVQWTDERGRLVTETTELRYTNRELKNIILADSAKLSDAEKQLYEAAKEIEALNIKSKDVDRYEKIAYESVSEDLLTEATYDENKALKSLKSIKTANLEIDFTVQGDSILVDHSYKTDIHTVVNRKPDRTTRKGNKRFFVARWVNPRYTYWSTSVSDDPKATIESSVSINFQKNKGKRK